MYLSIFSVCLAASWSTNSSFNETLLEKYSKGWYTADISDLNETDDATVDDESALGLRPSL